MHKTFSGIFRRGAVSMMREIGLVRDDPLHIVGGQTSQFECFPRRVTHDARGEAEDLPAIHMDVLLAFTQGLLGHRVAAPTADRHGPPVSAKARHRGSRLHDECTGSVAEQDTGLASPVDECEISIL
jgi:hypothetical protein